MLEHEFLEQSVSTFTGISALIISRCSYAAFLAFADWHSDVAVAKVFFPCKDTAQTLSVRMGFLGNRSNFILSDYLL